MLGLPPAPFSGRVEVVWVVAAPPNCTVPLASMRSPVYTVLPRVKLKPMAMVADRPSSPRFRLVPVVVLIQGYSVALPALLSAV